MNGVSTIEEFHLNSFKPIDPEYLVWSWDNSVVVEEKPKDYCGVNVCFLGTGSSLIFGKHKYAEEGDIMCKFAHDQHVYTGVPTAVVRGIATSHDGNETALKCLDPRSDFSANGKLSTSTVTGHGAKDRIEATFERFVLPNIFQQLQNGAKLPIKLNVQGHSRGAITTMAFASCVDSFFNNLLIIQDEAGIDIAIDNMLRKMPEDTGLDHATIKYSLQKIRDEYKLANNNLPIELNLVCLDPVEGDIHLRDFRSGWGPIGNYTDITGEIAGISVTYGMKEMPKTVKNMHITLCDWERRSAFRPSLPIIQAGTCLDIGVVPGSHSLLTGFIGKCSSQTQDGVDSFKYMQDHLIKAIALGVSDLTYLESALYWQDNSGLNLPAISYNIISRAILFELMQFGVQGSPILKLLESEQTTVLEGINFEDYNSYAVQSAIKIINTLMERVARENKLNTPQLYQACIDSIKNSFSTEFLMLHGVYPIFMQYMQEVKEDTSYMAGNKVWLPLTDPNQPREYFRYVERTNACVTYEAASLDDIPRFSKDIFLAQEIDMPEGITPELQQLIREYNKLSVQIAHTRFCSKSGTEVDTKKLCEIIEKLVDYMDRDHELQLTLQKIFLHSCFVYKNLNIGELLNIFKDRLDLMESIKIFNHIINERFFDKMRITVETSEIKDIKKFAFELNDAGFVWGNISTFCNKDNPDIAKALEELMDNIKTKEVLLEWSVVQDMPQEAFFIYHAFDAGLGMEFSAQVGDAIVRERARLCCALKDAVLPQAELDFCKLNTRLEEYKKVRAYEVSETASTTAPSSEGSGRSTPPRPA